MPKRVFGICPFCKRSVTKRYGKLLRHFFKLFKHTRAEKVCPGSGKHVRTHTIGK